MFTNLQVNNRCTLIVLPQASVRAWVRHLLARQEVYLFITGLVQQFHIRPPEGVDRIDPKDHVRSTLAPTSFKVRLIARDDLDA